MAFYPGPPTPPRRQKADQRYQKAYENWLKALYNDLILGKNRWIWVEITEILPPSKHGFAYDVGITKWVSGADWEANYEPEAKSSGRWSMGRVITEYDQAYFLLAGWARRAHRPIPPKHGQIMTSEEVLKAIADVLKQYNEPDCDGEPITIGCDIVIAGSMRYRFDGDKFNRTQFKYDPAFLAVVQELKDKGYSVGYGAKLKPRQVVDDDCEAEEYHITIYGPDAGFNEYKGYKVGYRTSPPTFV